MKFFIVLLAVVAAASAGYVGGHGYGGHAIAQPWVAPAALVHAPVVHAPLVHGPVVHASLPWVAPAPKYVKIAAPIAHHHKETYHVANLGAGSSGSPALAPPHPHAISYKANEHVNRIHYNGNTVGHPHLVGVEHYHGHAEPEISVVKTHGHGHGW